MAKQIIETKIFNGMSLTQDSGDLSPDSCLLSVNVKDNPPTLLSSENGHISIAELSNMKFDTNNTIKEIFECVSILDPDDNKEWIMIVRGVLDDSTQKRLVRLRKGTNGNYSITPVGALNSNIHSLVSMGKSARVSYNGTIKFIGWSKELGIEKYEVDEKIVLAQFSDNVFINCTDITSPPYIIKNISGSYNDEYISNDNHINILRVIPCVLRNEQIQPAYEDNGELILSENAFFKDGSYHRYRTTFLYDGFIESPMHSSSYEIRIYKATLDSIGRPIVARKCRFLLRGMWNALADEASHIFNRDRVTHINLYHCEVQSGTGTELGEYRLVKKIPINEDVKLNTQEILTRDNLFFSQITTHDDEFNPFYVEIDGDEFFPCTYIEDDGTRYASYEANSGLPQTRKYINLKDYSASALYAGSMFAGNVQFMDDKSDYDEDMTSRLIVRSLPGRLSVFDYVNEFAILPFTAKALAVFAYKLYAFGSEGYAVINPSTFQVELTSEKVFCDNPDFVCSVEEGLFVFCNGKLFVIDGFNTTDISLPISRSSDRRFIGLDDIDVSKVFYHSNTESIMVMGTINKKESIINEEYQPDPITVAGENLLTVYMQDIKSIDSVNNESNDKTLPPISLCTNWGNEAYLEGMHPFFNNGDIVMFALSLKTKQWRLIKPFENSEGNKLSPLFLDNKNYFIYYNAEQSHCYDLFQDKTPAKSEDTINRLKSLYISRKIYITSEAISAFLYSIKFNFERIYTNTTLKVLFFKENRKVKEVSLATGDKYYDRFIELNTWLLEDHEKTSLNDRKFNYIIIEIEGKFENISSILTIARGLVK